MEEPAKWWYSLTAMKKHITEKYITPIQLKMPVDMERIIEISDPVYTFNEVMEHIDLNKYIAEEKDGYMLCPNGKRFNYLRTEPVKGNQFGRTEEYYRCEDCDGCPHRASCHRSSQNRTYRNLKFSRKSPWVWFLRPKVFHTPTLS